MKTLKRELKFRTIMSYRFFKHMFFCPKVGSADYVGLYSSGIPSGIGCENCHFSLFCSYEGIDKILKPLNER